MSNYGVTVQAEDFLYYAKEGEIDQKIIQDGTVSVDASGEYLAIGASGKSIRIQTQDPDGQTKNENTLHFGDASGYDVNLTRLREEGNTLFIGQGTECVTDFESDDYTDLTTKYKKLFGTLDFEEGTNNNILGPFTNGHFTLSNKLYVPEISFTSDKRYKKDIKKIPENILQKLSKLDGYTFNWKYENEPTKTFGLMAQEVEKEFPELIRETKHDEKELQEETEAKKVLNYQGMIAILVSGLNQLQKEVNELKKQIS